MFDSVRASPSREPSIFKVGQAFLPVASFTTAIAASPAKVGQALLPVALFTTAISASPAKVGQAFLPVLPYERQRKVTGPSIGCAIGAPVRRDSIKFAFSAKYHFAGRSASSINIKRGLCFNPSACWIIVS